MQLYLKKMNYILKEKPLFLNFIRLLPIQVEKEKKSQRSKCCLNTLWFHFTLLISGWSLKSNSKGKWKYFTQKIESICFSIWKPIGKKTWVFKNWILTIGSWCGFFPPSLHEDLNHSQGEWNRSLSSIAKLNTCLTPNYLEKFSQPLESHNEDL